MTQEALKKIYQLLLTEPHAPTVCAQLEAIAREALAQSEQEPVAKYLGECREGSLVQLYDDVKKGTNFYTHPPQRTEQCLGFDVVIDPSMPANTMKFVHPAQRKPLTMIEQVDAAMVATKHIYPPITRSQCELIIRAAAHGIKENKHD
jgi:hypothetical protein